ncbi:DNA pilot protein [Dipodfec virus UOA04_Rod_565]|nr:DNA pilot protein [Dipodfec virus UOA04_Rod_565]
MGWLKGAAESAAGGLLGSAASWLGDSLGIGSGARNYRYQKKLMDKQYELNEKAAKNAYQRTREMYDYDYDKHTYEAMRKQMEDAGLSVGLMYGGGGTAGVGGGSTGNMAEGGIGMPTAPGAQTMRIDPLTEAQIENINADTDKKEAEKNQLEKTGEKTEAETRTENEMREYLVESKRQEAVRQWIANCKEFAKEEIDPENSNWMQMFKNKTLDMTYNIGGRKQNGMEIMAELTDKYADIAMKNGQTDLANAMKELNDEKKKAIFIELGIAAQNADSERTRALAQQLIAATESKKAGYATGEKTNWKTWTDYSMQFIEALMGAGSKLGSAALLAK